MRLSARIYPVLAGLCGLLLAACAAPVLGPGEALVPDDARLTHRAVLIGTNHHRTVGTISLYDTGGAPIIMFEQNFQMTAAPDVEITLGRDGITGQPVLAALARPAGRQAYIVPKEIATRGFDEIWLRQKTGDRSLGRARLTPL